MHSLHTDGHLRELMVGNISPTLDGCVSQIAGSNHRDKVFIGLCILLSVCRICQQDASEPSEQTEYIWVPDSCQKQTAEGS